jgi:hypothetical protein
MDSCTEVATGIGEKFFARAGGEIAIAASADDAASARRTEERRRSGIDIQPFFMVECESELRAYFADGAVNR